MPKLPSSLSSFGKLSTGEYFYQSDQISSDCYATDSPSANFLEMVL